MKILLASSNNHKIIEMRNIFKGHEIISLRDLNDFDEVEENGETFKENAFIKANYFYKKYGYNVLSDDSGLAVDYLNGAPGVYSSRYAGEDCNQANNRKKLLKALAGINDRTAKFVCDLCFIEENGNVNHFTGECLGRILEKETGKTDFGYDCLFYSNDLNKSFGEASEEEKDAVSHRGRAAIKMLEYLKTKNN